jgi:hypothetical protein
MKTSILKRLTAVLLSFTAGAFCFSQTPSEKTGAVSNTGTPYFSDPALSPDART